VCVCVCVCVDGWMFCHTRVPKYFEEYIFRLISHDNLFMKIYGNIFCRLTVLTQLCNLRLRMLIARGIKTITQQEINQLFTSAQHLLLLIIGLYISTDQSVIFRSLICCKFQGAVHTFGIPIVFTLTV